MIFAAGLGTRLRPLTDSIPKALVPIGGHPVLEHVIQKLKHAGFSEVVINVHHFADQVIGFLHQRNNFGLTIHISDERGQLLDTGGGLLRAERFFASSNESILLHNVDILSNADLAALYRAHSQHGNAVTLLVSERKSGRYLFFDSDNNLLGWRNTKTGETRPSGLVPNDSMNAYAFSGIHVVSPCVFELMRQHGFGNRFPIMDFYLSLVGHAAMKGYIGNSLRLLDIGKADTLAQAEDFIMRYPLG